MSKNLTIGSQTQLPASNDGADFTYYDVRVEFEAGEARWMRTYVLTQSDIFQLSVVQAKHRLNISRFGLAQESIDVYVD